MDVFKKIVSERLRVQVGEAASQLAGHPDADTLSAFSEQALSDAERRRVLEHMADCRDCRDTVYFALPSSDEMQKVVVPSRRAPAFAMRWGTLAAGVAIGAILLVSTRKRTEVALYKSAEAPKAAPVKSAELKTPADVAEMRVLRDDRASAQKETDKVIPTPKHMTARPAANFDIDQSGQVRMTPRSEAAPQVNAALNGRNFTALNKLDSPAPAAASGGVVGGMLQTNASAADSASGNQLHRASEGAPGAVGGTIVDPSGAAVANATVTVNGPTGTRAQQSDGQGQFAFDRLTPGSYSLNAQARGFQTTEIRQVAVLANQSANLQVQLRVGAVSETVEVSGQETEVATASQPAQSQLQAKALPSPVKDTKASRAKVAQNSRQVESFAKNEIALKKAGAAPVSSQWTLASDGSVQRSFDGGASWQPVSIPSLSRFRALSSAGADVWIGGDAGVLFHSADAGQTWKAITPIADGQKLQSDITRVDFSDALNGAITTANGRTWITSDGGQSWSVR